MLRDGIDEQMAQERINSQMTNSEYEKYADFIIINNDDNVGLEECVEQLYIKIKNISKAEDEAFPSTKKTQ
jgi:dephospho-CoA kinase